MGPLWRIPADHCFSKVIVRLLARLNAGCQVVLTNLVSPMVGKPSSNSVFTKGTSPCRQRDAPERRLKCRGAHRLRSGQGANFSHRSRVTANPRVFTGRIPRKNVSLKQVFAICPDLGTCMGFATGQVFAYTIDSSQLGWNEDGANAGKQV